MNSILPAVFLVVSAAFAGAGQRLPDERRTLTDPATGVRLTALTTAKARDDKIYQTHPSFSHDGRLIVFVSDRAGSSQLFAVDRGNGAITQLTDDPRTTPGLVYLSRSSNRMYYARGRSILDMDLGPVPARAMATEPAPLQERKIVDLPEGWSFSGTFSVDADGKSLYLGLGNEAGSAWAVHQIDIGTGRTLHVTPVPFRVGHVQANPCRTGVAMLCHETGGDSPQRIYVMNGPNLAPEPFYRETYNEWATHEVWWGADEAIFIIWPSTDEMRKKPYGLTRVRLQDGSHEIIHQYPFWHVCGLEGERYAVADTFQGDLFLVDVQTRQKKLLTTGHRPKGATVHLHPSSSPDGKQVLFCSEMLGSWDLMLVDVPSWEDLR
jgi:oligogalacturonide lyase